MKFIKLLPALVLVAGLSFSGCKPKDADIQASVEKTLKENAAASNVTVSVTEGVATLNGEVADEAAKASVAATAGGVKNVKSVVNNLSVPAPVVAPAPAPVVITADDPLTKSVADATKDFPGVTATVADGVVTLTGEIKKASLAKLMMSLNSLKPKKIDNKLTVK